MKEENVQLRNGVLLVKGKGEKERTVPIATDHLNKELQKAVRRAVAGPLFVNRDTGKPYTPTAIRKALNRAAVKAKLNMRIYPHLLRHSYGTHALVAGMGLRTVQEVMGHSSSKTTEGYTHLAGEFLKEETKKFSYYIGSHKKGKKL